MLILVVGAAPNAIAGSELNSIQIMTAQAITIPTASNFKSRRIIADDCRR